MAAVIPDTKRTDLIWFKPENLIIVGYDTNQGEEHTLYDERVKIPLSEEMVLDIMIEGVLQSIQVIRNGKHYEVINGRRRVLHAREANKRLVAKGEQPIMVPAEVKSGLDTKELMSALISTNEHVLADNILTKAAKASRAINKCGMSLVEAGIKFGRDAGTIAKYLKIHALHDLVKDAIADDKIGAYAALVLSDYPREEQPAKLAEILASAAEREVQKKLSAELDAAEEDEKLTKRVSARETRLAINARPTPKEIKDLVKADMNSDGVYLSERLSTILRVITGKLPLETDKELCEALKLLRSKKEKDEANDE